MFRSPFDDYFQNDPLFGSFPSMNFQQRAPPRSTVRIQEIPDEGENEGGEHNTQPIVEEPHNNYQSLPSRTFGSSLQQPVYDPFLPFPSFPLSSMMQSFGNFPRMMDDFPGNARGGSYYSCSQTSYSSSGPDGNPMYYTKSSSTKKGPSGILEKQESERDSSTGIEKISIHRQLGDRARTVTRQRDLQRGGQEECQEILRGISSQNEAARFDEEWRYTAASNLHPHDSGPVNRTSVRTIDLPHPSGQHVPSLPPSSQASSANYGPDTRSHRSTRHNTVSSSTTAPRSTRHNTVSSSTPASRPTTHNNLDPSPTTAPRSSHHRTHNGTNNSSNRSSPYTYK